MPVVRLTSATRSAAGHRARQQPARQRRRQQGAGQRGECRAPAADLACCGAGTRQISAHCPRQKRSKDAASRSLIPGLTLPLPSVALPPQVGESSGATADFLENTLWNRTLGSMSEEIVAALVCQIFEGALGGRLTWIGRPRVCAGQHLHPPASHSPLPSLPARPASPAGIRDHFVQSVELKFNCFFLMPIIDTFPTRLREELESAYEEDLDEVRLQGCRAGLVGQSWERKASDGQPALRLLVQLLCLAYLLHERRARIRFALADAGSQAR